MIKLELVRHTFDPTWTMGTLLVDDVWECWTLEDADRLDLLGSAGTKVPGKTAIPAGTYAVAMTPSPKFGRLMPQVLDVPGFTGIRIHPGNTAADTEGCILTGLTVPEAGKIAHSQLAFAKLSSKIRAARDGVSLTVRVPYVPSGVLERCTTAWLRGE